MSYPPGWKTLVGDRGTATVASFNGSSRYVGYLNLTPRQGGETLTNWRHFRVEHNAGEGDRHIATLAVVIGRPFGDGHASCVKDSYTTTTGARYTEIACLVVRRRVSFVIVGASPPQAWTRVSRLLEQAISSVTP